MGLLSSIGSGIKKVAGAISGSGIGAAITPFAPYIGGALSFLGGERRNTAQTGASKDQMKFQERMSSTAHQRQMADLKKAGLNPLLAAKYGGASSPGGAMPQISDTLTPAVNTATAVASNQANIEVAEKTADVLIQNAGQVEQQKYLTKSLQALASVDYNARLNTVKILAEEVKLMKKRGQIATLKYTALKELLNQVGNTFPAIKEILENVD